MFFILFIFMSIHLRASQAITTPHHVENKLKKTDTPTSHNTLAQKIDHIKLRILDKGTGEYSTFKFTEKKNYCLNKNIKVCIKSMHTQTITPSLNIKIIFVEVWEKSENSDLGNEWALVFSNWLSNSHNTFMHEKWHIHICE